MQKELIYEQMNGFLEEDTFLIPKEITIEDEFAEGKECSQLYERAYHAKQNLCRRLGKDEDNDVEILISSMRKEANMTQRQFAGYFGIPTRTVEDWERGLRHMPDYLMRLLVYKMEMEGLIKKHPEWEDFVGKGEG